MFLANNDRRHQLYGQILSVRNGGLDGPVNGDWMHREAARHIMLARVTGTQLSGVEAAALALPKRWENERQLHDWLELHNRIHLRIDKRLNL